MLLNYVKFHLTVCDELVLILFVITSTYKSKDFGNFSIFIHFCIFNFTVYLIAIVSVVCDSRFHILTVKFTVYDFTRNILVFRYVL